MSWCEYSVASREPVDEYEPAEAVAAHVNEYHSEMDVATIEGGPDQ